MDGVTSDEAPTKPRMSIRAGRERRDDAGRGVVELSWRPRAGAPHLLPRSAPRQPARHFPQVGWRESTVDSAVVHITRPLFRALLLQQKHGA